MATFKVPKSPWSIKKTPKAEYFKTRLSAVSPVAPKLTMPDLDAINSNGFDVRNITGQVPKPWTEWSLKDFEIGRPLGDGLMGHVYLARTRDTKFIVALKVIHAKQVEEYKLEGSIGQETEIHASLEHDNVIGMYGFFRDGDKIVYVLEYAVGGEVYVEMKKQPLDRFDDERAATYVYQITHALEYLHSQGIMHRDIKPENLLIGSFGEIKMADFGWSIKATEEKRLRKSVCGTPDYLPPEMLLEQEYDQMIDIWCLGVLIYEFLVGVAPFYSDNRHQMEENIKNCDFIVPDHVDKDAEDLIRKLIVLNPLERLSLEQVRNHVWCEKNRFKGKRLHPMFDEFAHLLPELEERYKEVEANLNLIKLE